ncbi:MAG: hypothetical protein WA948_05120 [Pontixanthobacter sp.]
MTAAIAAAVGAFAMWHRAALAVSAPVPHTDALPEVPGWTLRDYDPAEPWIPRAAGSDYRLIWRYTHL